MDVKKTICIIGTFPPPITGMSLAFKTIADAIEERDAFNVVRLDFSTQALLDSVLKKLQHNFRFLTALKKETKKREAAIYYLGVSCSGFGCIRDYLIVKTIKKNHPDAKIVLHHHGGNYRSFYEGTSKGNQRKMKYVLDSSSAMIALTPKLAHLFDGLLPPEKVYIVSNGINREQLLPRSAVIKKADSFGLGDYFHIVYLSNMQISKGHRLLLEAAKILIHEQKAKLKVSFAGTFIRDDDRKWFDSFVEQNDLAADVSYLGTVGGDAKNDLLARGDVFVLPTSFPPEGQPISILEAMAAGMVVISTDRGGISDVVKDGINGAILKDATAECLADTLRSILSDSAKMKEMSIHNRDEVESKYLESHYVDNMIHLFQNV